LIALFHLHLHPHIIPNPFKSTPRITSYLEVNGKRWKGWGGKEWSWRNPSLSNFSLASEIPRPFPSFWYSHSPQGLLKQVELAKEASTSQDE
ncbi:unnamed protein product, partial [Linum tenue]